MVRRDSLCPHRRLLAVAAMACVAASGCMTHGHKSPGPEPLATLAVPAAVPTELSQVALPPYVIGPPDVLLVEVTTPPKDILNPPVTLSLPIGGNHLVQPDGTIDLGVYGSVAVAGLTVDQAKDAVRGHVFERLGVLSKQTGNKTTPPPDDPNKLLVVVSVVGYNSKAYFVITDGAGYGEQVYRFPYQGHENVLDALSNINGLPAVGSKAEIWLARRTPHANTPEQVLPVDYLAITQHAVTQTNYQVLPGDRLYVKAEKAFRVDGYLAKALSPIERLLGVTLLGSSTYNSVTNRRQFINAFGN